MSEPEFDMYLSLMSKFLRLNAGQKADIAEELRVHLEERLDELMAQGKSRDDAIRLALDEFGDAGALAWQFTLPHSLRRRRQIMRYSMGSFAAIAGIFCLVSLTWPSRPDAPPAAQRVSAQNEAENAPDDRPAAPEAAPEQSLRDAIEAKLEKRDHDLDFSERTLKDTVADLSEIIDVDILFETADESNDPLITLRARKGALSIKTALELILRQASRNMTPGLDYVIKDGVILITNNQEDYEVQVYDCRDLQAGVIGMGAAGQPVGGMGGGGGFFSIPAELAAAALTQMGGMGGGMGGNPHAAPASTSTSGAALINVIQSATHPGPWVNIDGEGGSISEFNGVLVVRHNQSVHRKIKDVLMKLRKVDQGQRAALLNQQEDAGPLEIPRGKRLVTLSGNGWQVPLHAIRPGSRVDVIRFLDINDEKKSEVVLANAEIVFSKLMPFALQGIPVTTMVDVGSVSLIVTPEEAVNLQQTELMTPYPLKFHLRSAEEDDDAEPEMTEDEPSESEDR